jgi:hypothetical protein
MTRYLISFPRGAMDHIPAEELPAVGEAAHAVAQELTRSLSLWPLACKRGNSASRPKRRHGTSRGLRGAGRIAYRTHRRGNHGATS